MRQSPLLIVYKGISIIRNAVFFYLFLFVVKRESSVAIIEFGRHVFWLIVCLSVVYILADWWVTTFKMDAHHLTKRSGILFRKTQQIPVTQLEQVTVKRHWFHRLTNTVSFSYQLIDANEELKIDMIDEQKMNHLQMKQEVQHHIIFQPDANEEQKIDMIDEQKMSRLQTKQEDQHHVIFQPTHKQLVKASFTSLRFLLAIPFLVSLYSRVDHFIHLEQYTVTFIENVKTDTVWLVGMIIGYVAVSVVCAVVFTFVKFGKNQVVKNGDKIVIRKGLINESKVTVELSKISGIEVRQSFLKRLLGLAEIRLQFKSNDANELQSIYPYFEYEQAIEFVNTHFPAFSIFGKQEKLTKASLIPRLFRASILMIVLWISCYIGRNWLPFTYYWVSIALSFTVLLGVMLAYKQFQFAVNHERIQLRHGIFGSKVTIIKFCNICSLELEQSLLQRWLGLRTLAVRTYTDQLVEYQLKDVRVQVLHELQQGYLKQYHY